MVRKLFIILILAASLNHTASAEVEKIYGNLINGRGTADRLDGVRLFFYLNGANLGTSTTDEQGRFEISLVTGIDEGRGPARQFQLSDNYPNPFNSTTRISYSLHRDGYISLDIYNILGQKVRTLIHQYQNAGDHAIAWDGLDEYGRQCVHGTYFYHVQFGDKSEIRKMLYLDSMVDIAPASHWNFHKSLTTNTLEVQIKDRDLSDTTYVYQYDELPGTVELNNLRVHVYPFLKEVPDTLTLMSGENADDTLNIYFEKPIEILPLEVDFDYKVLNDSLVSIHYKNVDHTSAYLKIKEIDYPRISYGKIYFNLDPRLTLKSHSLRRAYLGIDYKEYIIVRNNRGIATLTLLSEVPAGLTYDNGKIFGVPNEVSETMLYVEMIDNRNIVVPDSIYLSVRNAYDINLNDYIIEVLGEYPRDGTHRYLWVNTYDGVTRDIYYKNKLVASANPDNSGSCFCCGLTFEVFFRSLQRLFSDLKLDIDVNGMSGNQMRYFLSTWFVQQNWGDGPGLALEQYGIGDKIQTFPEVKRGDFLQFWRTTGSGHSVIFIDWMLNSVTQDTIGFRYWSTQGSTNGINYNTEYFNGQGGTVNTDLMFFARLRSPEDYTAFSRSLMKENELIPIVPHPALDNTEY